MRTRTSELNPEQQRAAEHISGGLLVLAPVGTGKTTVLTKRVSNALRGGIPASAILCLSFTNKAANEVRERVRRAMPKEARELTVSTFHGLCARMVRQEARLLAVPADFVIYDEDDAKQVLLVCAGRQIAALPQQEQDALASLLFAFIGAVKRDLALNGKLPDLQRAFDRVEQEFGGQVSAAYDLGLGQLVADYNQALLASHALDFGDLIELVARLFQRHPDALARWQAKFRWIQVDEVQDTNPEEYAIIAQLAAPHGNLAFFGDVDQTIYEWRGSSPDPMLRQFRAAFGPVTEIRLMQNYRSTQTNVAVCRAVLGGYARATHRHIECAGGERGAPVGFHTAPSLRDEGRWIAAEIADLRSHGEAGSIAVLTRAHFVSREISDELEKQGVEHARLEQFPFYRRAEVKDALAYLRLLRNPYDANSLHRVLQAPPRGIGKVAHEAIEALPPHLGLRMVDFANPSTFNQHDPFGLLLACLDEGEVVVFDVETTGTDADVDEIIELAAIRVGPEGEREQFHSYLRPSRPLGDSQLVHHYTDAFLRTHGKDPASTLQEFLDFINGCVLVGHNVAFDIGMITSNAQRYGITLGYLERADTLELARRFLKLERYRLIDVRNALGTPTAPDHSAIEDVKATWEVLAELLKPIRTDQGARRLAVQRYRKQFEPLAGSIGAWRTIAEQLRPAQLLRQILGDSGLTAHIAAQPDGQRRLGNLGELLATLERIDDPRLSPARALDAALNSAALGSDLDRYGEEDTRVRLLSVHQAKGMEFDTVFIAGAVDSFFPFYHSHGDQHKLDEEHRVFYVAVSRARKRLYISYHDRDRWNRRQRLSRYAALIPHDIREEKPDLPPKAVTGVVRGRIQPQHALEDDLF